MDDAPVLIEALYKKAMDYALQNMTDDDEYRESQIGSSMSGKELRAEHNSMERYFAKDGTYEPKYCPSPSSGEVEFSSKI